MREDKQISPILHILLQILNLSRSEAIFRCSYDKQLPLLNLLIIDSLFVETDLNVSHSYLVALLVLLHKFLEVGTRVAQLLLADVEDYLDGKGSTTFCVAIVLLFLNVYLKSRGELNSFKNRWLEVKRKRRIR